MYDLNVKKSYISKVKGCLLNYTHLYSDLRCTVQRDLCMHGVFLLKTELPVRCK